MDKNEVITGSPVENECVGTVDESDLTAECPYCHSTNIKKVSHLYKIVDLLLRGIYAMDRIGVRWHCNNCGKDF
ncbi:MAG: hypothetical protein VB119_02925 [Candidatus Metalachnospira sp.]|nr:hypothetical protein [Candidatus Metalachnospira sp.]